MSLTSNISSFTESKFKSRDSFENLRSCRFQKCPWWSLNAKIKMRYWHKCYCLILLGTPCIIVLIKYHNNIQPQFLEGKLPTGKYRLVVTSKKKQIFDLKTIYKSVLTTHFTPTNFWQKYIFENDNRLPFILWKTFCKSKTKQLLGSKDNFIG